MLGTGHPNLNAGMSGNTAESGFTPASVIVMPGPDGDFAVARWSAAGHAVAGMDLPLTEAFAEALPGADTVFLCIPAGAMAGSIAASRAASGRPADLADITSVKMPLGQMGGPTPGR